MLFTLLLTTAILMIRPAEVIPAIAQAGIPMYEIAILLCLLTSFQTILGQFERGQMALAPLTTTILAYFGWMAFCHLPNGQLDEFFSTAEANVKTLIFYFLVVGVLSTQSRLFIFLRTFVLLGSVATLLAFLHLWKYVEFVGQANARTGSLERMGATGIFKDPNDMASILAIFLILSLFFATKKGSKFLTRIFWLAMMVFFFQGILATASRGGLAAAGAGLFAWCLAKFGKKGLIVVPVMVVGLTFIGGRQSDLSLSSGTGQGRIQLQHEGLVAYVRKPLFGIGPNHYEIEVADHVAHNSYLQAFTETGFFGGALFCAGYGLSMLMLLRLGKPGTVEYIKPDLLEFRQCLIAVVFCEMVAKMSLTQNWLLTTYLVWAIVTVYLRLCIQEMPIKRMFQTPLIVLYGLAGVVGSVFFLVYLKTMVRFG